MSIVRSLLRLVDSIQHREEEAKQKRWMQQFATPDPDDGDPLADVTLKPERKPMKCKFCGRVEREARYCPDCLADTLEPVSR